MRHSISVSTLIAASLLGGVACGPTTGVGDGKPTAEQGVGKPESDGKPVGGKADEWNHLNNPERFRVDFDYKLSNLPESGEAETTPWPETYWPTWKDSTNQRWQGTDVMSPLEKYDVAFNGWTPPEGFMDLRPFNSSNCASGDWDREYYEKLGPAASYQSKYKGNAKARDGVDSDGDGEVDECGDNDGVETWWGLCHAWVPASILEAEPQRAVTHNGVTFEVGDIKALLITMYDRQSAIMMGDRCNEKDVKRDDNGRIIDSECRDSNAGAFHVTVTNMLGRYKRSFAEDRTYNYEVWNQPFKSYEIHEQTEMDAKAAMKVLGEDSETYTYNTDATRFAKVRMTVKYITEPSQSSTRPLVSDVENNGRYTGSDTYTYVLEMNDDGEILGGEWADYNQTSHPDFLWLPLAPRGGNPNVSLEKVRELLALSIAPETPDEPDVPADIRSFDSSAEVAVPDNDATGIVSTVTIDEDVNIGSLKVKVDITHTFRGDLEVLLERDGLEVPLHKRQGSGADDLSETYEVTEFNGVNARGTWNLIVRDRAARDTGTLRKWSLLVSSVAPDLSNLHEFVSTGLPLTIPDNDATGITNTISVPDSGTCDTVKIAVKLTHTYVGDLTITVSHNGVSKVLHSREGGSSDDIDKLFTVAGFDGGPLSGDWTLSVKDEAGQDVGNLLEWSIAATTR